jgi:hypothetical protein
MIDQTRISAELSSLEAQEQHLLSQLHELHGAQRLARHFLGLLERERDQEDRQSDCQDACHSE